MQKDFIITMAWPEGMVAATGSWYDKFASKNGKYRVGHSALILIDSKTKKACYFDFGRYHTPKGYGRVRDFETDADVNLMNAEEHMINGGLGDSIAQLLSKKYPTPVEMVGVNDSFGESGPPMKLMEKYGLTAFEITKAAKKVISRKCNE